MNLELPRDTLLHKRDKHSYGPYLTLSFVNLVKSGKSGIVNPAISILPGKITSTYLAIPILLDLTHLPFFILPDQDEDAEDAVETDGIPPASR